MSEHFGHGASCVPQTLCPGWLRHHGSVADTEANAPTRPAPKKRRRGRALENEILEAAWEELADKGWRGFTMDGVATRAGTGKAPLYARWPNRTALVRAAMFHNGMLPPAKLPSLGNLRADLIRGLQATVARFESPFGEAMRAVISEAGDRPFQATDDQQPIESVLIDLKRAHDRADPNTDRLTFRQPPGNVPAAVVNLGPAAARRSTSSPTGRHPANTASSRSLIRSGCRSLPSTFQATRQRDLELRRRLPVQPTVPRDGTECTSVVIGRFAHYRRQMSPFR